TSPNDDDTAARTQQYGPDSPEKKAAGPAGRSSYVLFDLNADPLEQGLIAGGFDLVVASNALHTASDLTAALRRVRCLVAPGGQLLGYETHDAQVFAPVFGALDSFYAHTDHALRPNSLLLAREQ
ncbi:methyltransferase domain-containing protein, partial [Streptomyces sp. NPDC046261]|uniref:methyltransferase domain-containing protein n=1 Tax=Streptomyces sp. NPDC046261 TaxID=3157200 RepID=UPI00341069D5